LEPTVQERAWTSPIWYRPEGIADLDATIRHGARSGRDRLVLRLELGALHPDLDPTRLPLTLRVEDDDEIFAVTIPPGTLVRKRRGWVLRGPFGGLATATLVTRGARGPQLVLRTERLDLARADRTPHMVTVSLASGVYRAAHTRLWLPRGQELVPGGS
jgi:hypothetical protein